MRKLKLKALELGAAEVLNREQLKKILGGDGGSDGDGDGTCTVTTTCYDKSGRNTGSVSCSSSYNICSKGTTWVSCDAVKTDC